MQISKSSLAFCHIYFLQLLLSVDNLSKQFVPRSALTECQSWSGFRPFDILMMFLKEFFENVNFEKKSADDNISIENYPACIRFYESFPDWSGGKEKSA